jgi:hypothetical protein
MSFVLCMSFVLFLVMFMSYALKREFFYGSCLILTMTILMAMLVRNFRLLCLIYVLFLASYSDLCLFEKLMLAFVDLILALLTRGRNLCIPI